MTDQRQGLIAVAPNPSVDRFFEVDRLKLGALNRPTLVTTVPGGKGINVARAADTLGANVTVVSIVAGHAGRWVAEELARARIAGSYVWAKGETRSCLAVHDAASGSTTEFNEPGPSITDSDWRRFVETLEADARRHEVGLVAVSGSLPPGAPLDGVAQLVRAAHRAGVRAIVDTSGAPLLPAFDARPWIVKLNVHEALAARYATTELRTETATEPDDESHAIAVAREFAYRTGGVAIITRGTNGAVLAHSDGKAMRIGPPPVRGAHPVGSGDAFLAGLAAATLAGRGLEGALRLAVGAGAANAQIAGPGRLDRADAFRLASSVDISTK